MNRCFKISAIFFLAVLCVGVPALRADWSSEGTLVCGAFDTQYGNVSVGDGSGGIITAWVDYRSGAPDIYAQRIDPYGNMLWASNGVAVCTASDDGALTAKYSCCPTVSISGSGTSIYCTAKTNSCGTVPAIGFSGSPSATAGSGFKVSAGNTKGTKCGLLIYGDSGAAALPFQGGILCVAPMVRRTVAVCDSTGTPGQCNGTLAIERLMPRRLNSFDNV